VSNCEQSYKNKSSTQTQKMLLRLMLNQHSRMQ